MLAHLKESCVHLKPGEAVRQVAVVKSLDSYPFIASKGVAIIFRERQFP